MNLDYSHIQIIIVLVTILLGYVVWTYNSRSYLNRILTWIILCVLLIDISTFLYLKINETKFLPATIILGSVGISFFPPLFYTLSLYYPRKKKFDKRFLITLYGISLVLSVFIILYFPRNYLLHKVTIPSSLKNIDLSKLPLAFLLLYFLLTSYSLLLLFLTVRNLYLSFNQNIIPYERRTVKLLMLVGIPLGYILSIFSVINYFFNIPFPWFGLFLGVFTAFMVILVFRFHLIDIKRLVNGILFYPSIIAILVFIYISFILQNQQELSRMFGLPEGVTLVLEVIIIYLAVSTLRKLFDLTYFKKRFPHLLASRFGNIEPLEYLSYSMTIKGLFSRLREVFRAHHKVDTIMVLLLNREKDVFEPVEKSPSFHIKNSGELARVVAKFNRGVTLEELLIYLNHRDEVELLHRYGVNLVLPVKRADEVIALILMPRPSIISSWSYQDITALNYIRYILPPLIDRCQMYENEKEIEKHQYRMEQLVVMGEMSSGLAHEIRNPLSIISTSVETILNRDCPAEDRNKMLRYIQEETTRINILVNKLLSINFQKKPEFEEVDLVYIFNRLKSFLKYELKDKNINFYIHNTQPLGIYSDPNMLFQIFLNLALNSIEALNGGGTISIDYIRRNNSVEIMVKDDGPGIPRELQQKVFDPFFTTKKKGSGLGLTVTRKLIENLFGDIRLLASGDGTCFKITFPILKRGREGESI